MKKRLFGISLEISMVTIGLLGAYPASNAFSAEVFHGAKAERAQYGVIFQIDSDSKSTIGKTLRNIKNALRDPRLNGKVQVELIANGKGYVVYQKGNEWEKDLQELKSEGVILAQCNNTLQEMKVDVSTLTSIVSIVPSGMGEIIIREGEGWAYIHPS